MDSHTKKFIKSYLQKYLEYKNPSLKIGKKKIFECPFSYEHTDNDKKPSCQIYTKGYNLKCYNPSHGTIGNIFDVVRKYEEGMVNSSDDDIADYLIHLLDIQTEEKTNELLTKYHEKNWGLIALSPNSKNPVSGQSWVKNTSYDINEWNDWIINGLGLGLRLGEASQIVAIDIDDDKTQEKIEKYLGETLIQKTKRGRHYIYEYEEFMKDIKHINFRNKGYDMELRANNAYVVIAPTLVDDVVREWNEKPIIKMPKELKELLLSLIDKPKEDETQELEKLEDTKLNGDLKGLDGRCNDTFIQLGGVLRKKLPVKQTEYALLQFNKLLEKPMPYKDIKSMMYQIARYNNYDKKELAEEVFNHLKLIEQSTARDLQASLGYEKKDIEEVLKYLIDEGKVYKRGHIYKAMNVIDWEEDFMKVGKPISFKIPYFDDIARFDEGGIIIIGARSGRGKTHCACNFLKHFVDQGIKPYYVCTETGSKFGTISASLGLKVGDYYFKTVSDASLIELPDNGITILDWIKASDSDYSKMDSIYQRLNDQLIKHKGFLIVMAQLKNENNSFYAESMTHFYASFVAKYNWTPIKNTNGEIYDWDSENTFFSTEKIRDSKDGKQYIKIPTHFNRKTKELKLRNK
ncbi:MAG: bifunctional DNA primase/polymerase [Candidatus Helarchaeota archaeon]